MSLYLMAGIGLKGAVQVAASRFTMDILAAPCAGATLSLLMQLPTLFALRSLHSGQGARHSPHSSP
jgi:hypothetical protein